MGIRLEGTGPDWIAGWRKNIIIYSIKQAGQRIIESKNLI
jgi:hypothetical protein